MEEEFDFKNGIERLEYLVGCGIDEIESTLDYVSLPNAKEIIELRFGLKDGKEYTLFEVADILKKKDEGKSVIDEYIDSIKHSGIKKFYEEWNAEIVRKVEAQTILELKQLIKLLYKICYN